MIKPPSVNGNLLRAACTVAVLTPMVQLAPRAAALAAGRAAWLSPILAAPVILLDIFILSYLMSRRREGEGLYELLCRALGKALGGAVAALFAAWAVFYCAFVLRAGADRFISTLYPSASPWLFAAVTALIASLCAMGRISSLMHAAKVLLPVLAVILVLALAAALPQIDISSLLPITGEDILPAWLGALRLAPPVCAILTVVCFLEGGAPLEKNRFSRYALRLIPMTLLFIALCAACLGNFGPRLTSELSHPFFSLLRNADLFGTGIRIEALVIAAWVLPDFILCSLLITAASRILMRLLAFRRPERARFFSMKNGRFLIPLCAALALAASLIIAPDEAALEKFPQIINPAVNLSLTLIIIPLTLLTGKLRKKI